MRFTAAVLVVVTGCSFAFVSGPPANHAQLTSFSCSSSNGVPILDTLFGVFEVANLILAAKDTDQDWNDTYKNQAPFSRKNGMIAYGSLTALAVAGAYYGFTRSSRCRDAKAELALRTDRQPPPSTPGWPPPPIPAPATPPAAPTPPASDPPIPTP